jgi:hypothetical protein
MGVFGLVSLIGSHVGSDDTQKLFKGQWDVTLGSFVQGIYGTTIQSYYGAYITHVVDGSVMGLGGLVGDYLNDSNPLFGAFGISGYVTWIFGPNITVNYGGPVAVIQRAPSITKTGKTPPKNKDDPGTPIPLPSMPAMIGYKPSGEPTTSGDDIAAADESTLTAVTLLSLMMNLMIASGELAVKFKYSDYDPAKDNQPVGGTIVDTFASLIVPAMMGVIYNIEKAGGYESWTKAAGKQAKDIYEEVGKCITHPITYVKSKMNEGGQSTEDTIALLAVLIMTLTFILLGVALGVA